MQHQSVINDNKQKTETFLSYTILCPLCHLNQRRKIKTKFTPDDGGLLRARHADTNDVIISDTMLRSLVPPQLRTMINNYKMMCGCALCNTSKYFQ